MNAMKQMKRRWTVVVLALVAQVAGTCVGVAAEPPVQHVAKPLARLTAHNEIISEQDLAGYLDHRIGLRSVARSAPGVEQVVREMVWTRVLTLEGMQLNIDGRNTASDAASPTLHRFDDAYGQVVQKKLEPVCERPASEQEARQYFDAHPQAFLTPAQVRLQRMMLPPALEVEGQPATNWLKAQVQAIAAGDVFADIAQRAQEAYTFETQGDLGWVPLEGDDDIITALRTAKEGELLGPLQVDEFVYLLQVTRLRPARQLAWEEVKASAAATAEAHCRAQAHKQVRERLFQKYGVEIDRPAIRAFFAQAVQRLLQQQTTAQ